MELKTIINSFEIEGEIESIQQLNIGLINTNYLVVCSQNKYVFQQINTAIFKNVSAIMENIVMVNEYLKNTNYNYELLTLISTKSKENLFFDANKNPWRCFAFIENKNYTFSELNNTIMTEYGKAIGHFHTCLANFDTAKITNTINNFHNTLKYFNVLEDLISNSSGKRKNEAEESFVFIQQFEDRFQQINRWIQKGKLPLRVCHNDTKIDNILFDTKGKNVKSIIDFDTIMSNSIIYDFGDAIRTSCNTSNENNKQISNVNFNFEFFKAFSKGYLKETQSFIRKEEINLLSFSGILLALEQAIRFFTDYLNGSIYYKTDYPNQNLDRGLNQIALAKKMMINEKEMENYIQSLSQS